MHFAGRDILDMTSLSADEISFILDTADSMKEISTRSVKKVPTLRGKTVVLLFHEPSTRTWSSFDIAAKRLSADCLSIAVSSSSMAKGETLIDTVKNLEAMRPDVIVLRHSCAGAPHMLAGRVSPAIINAGDGMHAHPSQALLDLMTVREFKGRLDGLRVAIIGDILHSRVARSDCVGFTKMGSQVIMCGPKTMVPKGIEQLGAIVTDHVEEAVCQADVIMMLRIQTERQLRYEFPTLREYARFFGLTNERVQQAHKDVLIMHPGPINRGIEISEDVADGPQSIILNQVTNGVAVRMALLYLVAGGTRDEYPD